MTRSAVGQWILLGALVLLVLPISFAFLNNFSVAAFTKLIQDPRFQSIFLRTLRQASLSTLGCMLVGIPGAWYWARYSIGNGKKTNIASAALQIFSILPFCLPPVIFVLYVILVFGNNGIINRWLPMPSVPFLYNSWAIIGAHVLYDMGIFIRFVGQALQRSIMGYALVAQGMGASKTKRFLTVQLPLLLPSIIHAAGITFLFCFTSFIVVIVLGSGPRDSTLEVMIYEALLDGLNIGRASAIAGFQALIGILIITTYMLVLRRQSREPSYRSIDASVQIAKPGLFHWAYIGSLWTLLVLPLIAIAVKIYEKRSILVTNELINLGSVGLSLGKTLAIGMATACLCASIAVLLCSAGIRSTLLQRFFINSVSGIPLCLSSFILVLSLLTIIPRTVHSSVFVVLVHSTLTLPFIVPRCMDYVQRFSETMIYAPRNLGAGWVKEFFSVRLPMSRSIVLSSASMGLLISFGEFNAVLYFGTRDRIPALSVYLFRSISRYRFEEGIIVSLVIVLFVALITQYIETLQRKAYWT